MHPLSSTIFFAQASSTQALKANDLLFSICTQDRGNVQTFAIYKFAFPKKKNNASVPVANSKKNITYRIQNNFGLI